MNIVLPPGPLSGTVAAPPSKSTAHRLILLGALSDNPEVGKLYGINRDVDSTLSCMEALLSGSAEAAVDLYPGESGSTLRFLLPLVGVLRKNAVFHLEGRLPERPLSPYAEELEAHGMRIEKDGALLYASGALQSGGFRLPANVSSQYISGLLMALPFLPGDSTLRLSGRVESENYIHLTENVLSQAGIVWHRDGWNYTVPGNQKAALYGPFSVEGDWSGAAFFLCLGALSEGGITVTGLDLQSTQGDREILEILKRFGATVSCAEDSVTVRKQRLLGIRLDASGIPDLVPTAAVVAALSEGETVIYNAKRLRLKESDRLKATAELICSLGGSAEETEDGLRILGRQFLTGGTVNTYRDHRIAMAAAVAAAGALSPVRIPDAECVEKSYPAFFHTRETLKGV